MAATLFRTFYINWIDKRFQLSDSNGGELTLAHFNKYECVPLKFIIVQPDPDDILSFSKVPVANLSLTVTINDTLDDATPLIQQASWAKDSTEQSFSGELDFNTAAMNVYMAGNTLMNPMMLIEVAESTAKNKIWQDTITVKGSVTAPTYTSPDPLLRYLTADEIEARFAQFINLAGRQFTLTSQGNLKQRIFGVTDGGSPIDEIVDV